jgi:predicted CXXCH cytochrome family protein
MRPVFRASSSRHTSGALKKATPLAAVLLFALWVPLASRSGITGTAHDFSQEAWNTSGETCLPCHTPHHAESSLVPLWNHQTTVSSFTLYSSDTLDAAVGQPSGSSKSCLSCHDGTVALNAFGGNLGSEFIAGGANLGTDLSNDHPISFTYDTSLALQDGDLFDPSTKTVPALAGQTIQDGMLFDNQMECSSCHDVHSSRGDAMTSAKLVIVDNAGSALCLTCHDK